jgi:dCMP deaminase
MDQYNESDKIAAKHLDLCMCLHAEENAILFVSKIDLKDSTIYITLIPCISCVKKILQCQIKRVVYINNYSPETDEISINMLKSNGVDIYQYNNI